MNNDSSEFVITLFFSYKNNYNKNIKLYFFSNSSIINHPHNNNNLISNLLPSKDNNSLISHPLHSKDNNSLISHLLPNRDSSSLINHLPKGNNSISNLQFNRVSLISHRHLLPNKDNPPHPRNNNR